VKPSRRRVVVGYMCGAYRVSERHACKVVLLPRATHRYQSIRDPLIELRMRLRELAQSRIRYGYRKLRVLLMREGWRVGKKLVYRLYREEGLGLRRRPKRRRMVCEHSRQKPRAEGANEVWSLDFVADQLSDGRRFRALTVVDIYTRECLAIEVGQSLKGHDVVRVLQQVSRQRGTPQVLFCDNGSEFTSQAMDLWAYHNQVKIDFSRPGKPTDNAYIESFNGTLRAECLDAHWFGDLAEAAQQIAAWKLEYNASRPHRALGERTPDEFAREIAASRDLSGPQNSRKLTLELA
jgi:putative transposase